jgi:hypothetical protein
MSDKKNEALNPEQVFGDLKSNFEKFKGIIDGAAGLSPAQKAHFAKLQDDLKSFEQNIESEKSNEIPDVIGVPFHAGAGDVEPCL